MDDSIAHRPHTNALLMTNFRMDPRFPKHLVLFLLKWVAIRERIWSQAEEEPENSGVHLSTTTSIRTRRRGQ